MAMIMVAVICICKLASPKRLDVGLVPAGVPEQPLMAETPRALLLAQHVFFYKKNNNKKIKTQHVHKHIDMEPSPACADPEHHAGAKYPLRDIDLPVISAAVQNPEN